jgi:hypothetical protein
MTIQIKALLFIYLVSIALIAWYMSRSIEEKFANETRTYVVDEARCMECVNFYQDVFQFSDPSDIVPYIEKRTTYMVYVLRQFIEFNDYTLDNCLAAIPEKDRKVGNVIECIGRLVTDLTNKCKDDGMSQVECTIIQRLSDRIISKAVMCGANECTVAEFRQRYKNEVTAVSQDLLACSEAFKTKDDLCVKMYTQVMNAKRQTRDVHDNNAVVKQSDLNDKIGEMASFMMTNAI